LHVEGEDIHERLNYSSLYECDMMFIL
jgi:hypothetical protein